VFRATETDFLSREMSMTRRWKQSKCFALVALASCIILITRVCWAQPQEERGKQFDLTCEIEVWYYSSKDLGGTNEGQERLVLSIDLERMEYMCREDCGDPPDYGPFKLQSVSNQLITLDKWDNQKEGVANKYHYQQISRVNGEYNGKVSEGDLLEAGFQFWRTGRCEKRPFTQFSMRKF
jgi:hypothetical protein